MIVDIQSVTLLIPTVLFEFGVHVHRLKCTTALMLILIAPSKSDTHTQTHVPAKHTSSILTAHTHTQPMKAIMEIAFGRYESYSYTNSIRHESQNVIIVENAVDGGVWPHIGSSSGSIFTFYIAP